MPDSNFQQAAFRHYRSAECLCEHQHAMDADHLYGLSAECVLKAMMVQFGVALLGDSGDIERKYWMHINILWNEYNLAMQGRNQSAYLLSENNPFSDWHVNQRYAKDSAVSVNISNKHQQATRNLLGLMQQAELSR